MNDEDTYQREGYMLFVEPMVGLLRFFMTSVMALVVIEVLRTGQGKALAQHLPVLIKAVLNS